MPGAPVTHSGQAAAEAQALRHSEAARGHAGQQPRRAGRPVGARQAAAGRGARAQALRRLRAAHAGAGRAGRRHVSGGLPGRACQGQGCQGRP